MKFSDQFKLDKFIKIMDEQEYPLFDTSLEKDELEKSPSFFVYSLDGRISKTNESHNQFQKEFTLAFFTRDDKTIDVLNLADQLTKAGLRFLNTEIDEGEFVETNTRTKMTTFNFIHIIKACDY